MGAVWSEQRRPVVSVTSAIGISAPLHWAVQDIFSVSFPFPLCCAPGQRTMSCCGTPRPENQARSVPVGQVQQFPVSHQPTAHPAISPFPAPEAPFRPPNIPSPQTVHSSSHLNGAHSPAPTFSTAHGSPPPTGPQVGMFNRTSVVDPNGSLSPLRLPSPAYSASGSPNIISTYQSAAAVPSLPPMDEGKMSVSIDFGEHRSLDSVPRRVRTDHGSGTTFSGVVSVSAPPA